MKDGFSGSRFGALAPGAWWLDAKLGLRMLAKYPGLTLSGGAGIAVAVAIAVGGYSVVQTNFEPSSFPMAEGHRMVSLELWDSVTARPDPHASFEYRLWREELKSITGIGAFRTLTANLIVPGAVPESVRVAAITASGFTAARVAPLLGRLLEPDDERTGAAAVVVIAETVWRNRFAADPAIVGRVIQLGSAEYRVVGVMPLGFAFPVNHQFWVPLTAVPPPPTPLGGPELNVFGRLAPGATFETAQAEVAAIGQRTARAFPELYVPIRPLVSPYAHPYLGIHGAEDVAGLFVTQGLVFSLLVLVCLNVAILVYTRTAMRQAEIGLRTALGAGRGRIVAQLFVEALVLSLVAAGAGVAIAEFAMRQLSAVTLPLAADLPFWLRFRISPQAVLYAVLLSVLAAVLVGVVPALQATGGLSQTGLRVVSAGSVGLRLGKTWTILIVAQVGFAMALLPPAVSKAWESMLAGVAGPGFAAHEFLSVQLGMDDVPLERFRLRQDDLIRRLKAEPQVRNVTFGRALPGDEPGARVEADGDPSQTFEVRLNRVDPGFFPVFGVPVLTGRAFTAADVAGAENAAVVVINQQLAQRLFGGNALGRRIRYVSRSAREAVAAEGRWYQVIGIVPNFPNGVSPSIKDSQYRVYHPVAAGQARPAAVAIRMSHGSPAAFVPRLRQLAVTVDPDMHLREIRPLDEALRREQWIVRLEAAVIVGVTLTVLLLSSVGIHALMSFTVSQRRREIGIRMALGASGHRIVAQIFSRALLQLGAGAALGGSLAWILEKNSGNMLMRGNALAVLAGVASVIMAVGLMAAFGPVWRSLAVEPTDALREQ